MKIIMGCSFRTGRRGHRFEAAFTLVELLLTVVLLLLLLGSVVFNYSSLSRGARLDHGADQLETLFRFARSQAASSGRQVRIVFDTASPARGGGSLPVPAGSSGPGAATAPLPASGGIVAGVSDGTNAPVTLVWEPDPYGAPGQFVPLMEAQSYLDEILESIEVIEVRLPGARPASPSVGWNGYSAVADKLKSVDRGSPVEGAAPSANPAVEGPVGPIQVAFYPDGSSDSFEVIIGSQEPEDSRRLLLSLAGVTGRLQKRTLDLDADGHPVEDAVPGERAEAQGWAPGINREMPPTASQRPVSP